MAKKSTIAKTNVRLNSQLKNIRVVNVVVVHIQFIANSNYAVFCFRELAYKGQIPGVKKASGNKTRIEGG